MSVLEIDCTNGATKEGIASALAAHLDEKGLSTFKSAMEDAGIDGLAIETDAEGASPRVIVRIDGLTESERARKGYHHHEHHSAKDVMSKASSLDLPETVSHRIRDVYDVLAHAEAKVHESTLEDVHFHEVGNDFAMAYIASCCLLLDLIGADEVVSTPISAGKGFVDCAHGRLPIPAPATTAILEDVPWVLGPIEGELCTPTGAALIRAFADRFEEA